MKSFKTALSILTTIPTHLSSAPNENTLIKSVYFFPLCGYIIALCSVISIMLISQIFEIDIMIQAIAIVSLLFIFTGGIHLDGLADSCDAMFCQTDRDNRLRILHDSRLGSFGTIGLILILLGKTIAIYVLLKNNNYLLIASAVVMARVQVIFIIYYGKYFHCEKGMGREIIGKIPFLTVFITTLYTLPCFIFSIHALIVAVIIAFIVFFIYKRCCIKLGGISGDILGAVIELSETMALILLTIYII